MSDEFLHAYHFVPTLPAAEWDGEVAWRNDASKHSNSAFGLGEATRIDGHAVYAEGGKSGRIVCAMRLETPTVFGAAQKTGPSGSNPVMNRVVIPYRIQGQPAAPATSIKGMVSSVVEQASRSRYRILTNKNTLTVAYMAVPGNRATWTRHPSDKAPGKIGKPFDYFERGSLPLDDKTGHISAADALFGYVRVGEAGNEQAPGVDSLAGKLRFSHAVLSAADAAKPEAELFEVGDTAIADAEIGPGTVKLTRLKEQGSPMKVPDKHSGINSATPNFYFKNKARPDDYVSKADFGLNSPKTFAPMGRKVYLHHVGGAGGLAQPWRSRIPSENEKPKDAARKAAVRPLKAGVTLIFHIDFDNLTAAEFDLLCFALRPSERFRHKIALGKGLGLGSVCITPFSVSLIDRKTRYGAGSPFAAALRQPVAARGELSALPNWHADAAAATSRHGSWMKTDKGDAVALSSLLAVGERHDFDGKLQSKTPVYWVPIESGKVKNVALPDSDPAAAELEAKTFAWFQKNDDGDRQAFRPIASNGKITPLLPATGRGAGRSSPGGGFGAARPAPAAAPAQQRNPPAYSGTVLRYFPEKSCGFARCTETGAEIYLDGKAVKEAGAVSLQTNQEIWFDIGEPPKPGTRAPALNMWVKRPPGK